MDNGKWLGLGLALGMFHAACGGEDDDRADTGAATTAAPGEGSADPTDAEGEESESGDPGDEEGGEDSTTDDPSPMTSASAGGEDSSGGEEGGEVGGDPSTGVRGAVIRSVAPAAGQDGIGTLYVGLLIECTADSAQAGGATPVEGADLSAEGSQVLYEVSGVAPGTYYLVAFLDDNLNADTSNPYADNADLVTAEGFAPGCVEVTIVDGQMATAPAAVDLNLVYPL